MPSLSSPKRKSLSNRIREWAFRPVDHASFTFFRIAFGVLMVVEVYRYFDHGWIASYWINPRFLFKYYGFSWVDPWPGPGMSIHWAVMGILAAFIAAGFLYRVSAALFFVAITYTFLLDQATYLNHMYLICLLSFLLIFVPANRAWSVDPLLGLAKRSRTIPAWALWMFRFQFAVVYFYGGIAKISPDWLRGEPMRTWIAGKVDLPIIGPYVDTHWMPLALSYGGLALDLAIAPLLLWRRTRVVAVVAAMLFHFLNAKMFNIGIFPWLAAAATFLFLSPSWPRQLLGLLRIRGPAAPVPDPEQESHRNQTAVLCLAGIYILVQLLVPLRHLLYPGSVDWTYEGHRFSWRMKLHDRKAQARFYVTDPNTGREFVAKNSDYLTARQQRKMGPRPDMILQYAHYLAASTPCYGPSPIRVEARIFSSLNRRKSQLFVNPTVNLAAQPRTLRHAAWLMPLTEPLPDVPPRAATKKEIEENGDAEGD